MTLWMRSANLRKPPPSAAGSLTLHVNGCARTIAIDVLAAVREQIMVIPLVAKAQVQMLAEGFLEPAPAANAPPVDLQPQLRFNAERIRRGLPEPGPFTCADLRLCARSTC